jgi:hypothetical protein
MATPTDHYNVYEELFDTDVMEKVLCDQGFSKTIRTKLSAYKRSRDSGNRVTVNYSYGKGCGALKLGRVFCKAYSGLQAFPRDIRDALTAKHYWDLDMENAHYWIMRNFCEKNGLRHDAITYYCENREDCLRKVSADRDLAKTAFLKIAYGGNIRLADINAEDDGEEPTGDISLIKECEKEISTVINYVKGAYPAIAKIATDMCKRKKAWADKKGKPIFWNADYTTLALVLQTEEHRALEAIETYLVSKGRRLDIPIHDGGRVRKLDNESHFPSELIQGAENAVLTTTGYRLKLKIKPLTPYADTENCPSEIIDEKYAARQFVQFMGNNIIHNAGEVYYYDEDTGIWKSGEQAYRIAVFKLDRRLIFSQVDASGKVTRYNYSGSEKNIMAMRKSVLTALQDIAEPTTIDITKSKYCLLFRNGWFDMQTLTFHKGFAGCREKFFTKRINRDFNSTRNAALEAHIRKVLFENPYNDAEVGPFYMNGIARAIAGCVDKAWWSIVGRPDCGKGVMTLFLSYVFDEYIGQFNMNVLKFNLRDGSDEAKKLAWYAPLIGCRIAIGNEARIDGKGLDGNLMKTMSSGGDCIKLRLNFQDEFMTQVVTTFFGFCNDLPPVTPCDQALKNRMNSIPHTKSFVCKPQAECDAYEMESDPELKDKIKREDWITAMFWLIVESYNGGTIIPKPAPVKAEIDELFVVDDEQIRDVLEEKYTFAVGDEEAFVPARDIINHITASGLRLSDTKIGKELARLGFRKGDKKIEGKKYRVWFGLKE